MSRVVKWAEGLEMDALDPADIAQYDIDLTEFLEGDAITSASAVGENITIDNTTYSGYVITVLVNTGLVDKRARVTFNVTTASESFTRSFYIPIRLL